MMDLYMLEMMLAERRRHLAWVERNWWRQAAQVASVSSTVRAR